MVKGKREDEAERTERRANRFRHMLLLLPDAWPTVEDVEDLPEAGEAKASKTSKAIPTKFCVMPDCARGAESGGLCSAHRKRKQRGSLMSAPVVEKFSSAWERLHAAALDLAEADSEDDIAYQRAEDRLRKAVDAIVLERIRTMSRHRSMMGA